MHTITSLTGQVHTYLLQTGGQIPRHEVYNHFIQECNALNLTEYDFYKKVLAPAYRSINWEKIETEKKAATAAAKAAQETIAKQAAAQKSLAALQEVVKKAMNGGVLSKEELAVIFRQARLSGVDVGELAAYIKLQLKEQHFQPFPAPPYQLLAEPGEDLLSTNWYDESNYRRVVTIPATPAPSPVVAPPPVTAAPAPAPVPRKTMPQQKSGGFAGCFLGVVLLAAVVLAVYFLWWQPYQKKLEAQKRYTIAINLWLRRSPESGSRTNTIQQLPYGTELREKAEMDNWSKVEVNGEDGYVNSKYLLDEESFFELNSIFTDTESRNAVMGDPRYARALMNYFQERQLMGNMSLSIQNELYGKALQKEIWQLTAKKKKGLPNSIVITKITDPKSKYRDFGFLIHQPSTGKRKFVLYSFTDSEEPQFIYEEDAPPDAGYIISVTPNYLSDKPYIVRYTRQ